MSEPIGSNIDDAVAPSQHLSVAVPFSIPRDGLVPRLMGGYQLLAGIVLAWFWLRSGLPHITNSYYFLSSIYSYEIVGPTLGVAAAMGFPALQLVLAAGLVTRRFVGGALLLSSLLLTVFAAAQVSALVRGLEIGCGCFGAVERQPIGGGSLVTTSLLLICALSAFICWFVGQSPRIVKSNGAGRGWMSCGWYRGIRHERRNIDLRRRCFRDCGVSHA
ncbi:MAG: MauE/DoxX family redox-associated membrane protein [Isosphaerales bacterium]